MKIPATHQLTLEFTAMFLYQDAVRTSPTFLAEGGIQAPAPRWSELGEQVRNTYRRAVLTMVKEQEAL